MSKDSYAIGKKLLFLTYGDMMMVVVMAMMMIERLLKNTDSLH